MAGFIRRFTEVPPVEVIRQIEGINIIDIAPPDPSTGTGSGTVLLVGEFEDGFFATDTDAHGSVEVFGSSDYASKFGEFGYTYNRVVANNPSARRHQSELWNGNGYLKAFALKAQRLLISRVDTSVGTVSFDPLSCISGGGASGQVFSMAPGDVLKVTTNIGNATSAALTAVAALKTGAAATFATITSGDSFAVAVDGGAPITVVFSASDTSQAAVIARINATVGLPVAVAALTQVNFSGIIRGTSSIVTLSSVTSGVLAKIGHTAGSVSGSGMVGNVSAVRASELAGIINADASMIAMNVMAEVMASGAIRVCNSVSALVSSISIPSSANPIGTAALFAPLDTVVTLAASPAGEIPAGTRVRNSLGAEWVTMQTLDVPASTEGPFTVRVRPALDDGTGLSTLVNTVNVLVDQPSFVGLVVRNSSALTAAKTEVQMDNAYIAALSATLNDQGPAREANYLLIARRTDTVVREGAANAVKATECGLFGRKYLTGDPLGTSTNTAIANVAKYRSDRVFYTVKGFKVRVPQIAERGTAGGLGFTSDGVITVRPDGPLATICASRPPEENPGQQTDLIDAFFEVDTFGEVLSIDSYKAYRREGIIAPRVDRIAGPIFQSGVTSSLESGRKTCARRKMADFIQDTLGELLLPYSKRINSQSRRNAVLATVNSYLGGLLSKNNPELQRIEAFSVDDSVNAGNTPESMALGIYRLAIKVRTLSSLDFIVATVEAGENTLIVKAN
jgi:hypothetical protein